MIAGMRQAAHDRVLAADDAALPREVEHDVGRREGDLLRRHQRDRLVAQAARGVLDAVGAGLDRQPRIRIGADMHRRPHLARLGFGHRRAEHLLAQPRQRTILEAGLEHQLDDVDALAIELGDRGARLLRAFRPGASAARPARAGTRTSPTGCPPFAVIDGPEKNVRGARCVAAATAVRQRRACRRGCR